jgi:hypothetical protein
MRELSPEFTRNAARLLLLALFVFSLWSISRYFFPPDTRGEIIPPFGERASLPFLRAAILVLPDDPDSAWPGDLTLRGIDSAHCNAVLLRLPVLLPVPGRGRIEYSTWLVDALPGIIARYNARGLHLTIEPFFVDAHGIAFDPAIPIGQRERFTTGVMELFRDLATVLAEGNGDALTIPASVLVGLDAEEQTMMVTRLREACSGLLSIHAARPGDVPDTVWALLDYITAATPQATTATTDLADTATWKSWSELALRVHKPIVASMPSARGGSGLWWDTSADRLLGWDESYHVSQARPLSAASAQWLASQPWLRGMAVEAARVSSTPWTALFAAIQAREFEKELSRAETVLRQAD